MRFIGWKDGVERVLQTNNALRLMQFSGLMDRVEYVSGD